jgi:hypothetical protein
MAKDGRISATSVTLNDGQFEVGETRWLSEPGTFIPVFVPTPAYSVSFGGGKAVDPIQLVASGDVIELLVPPGRKAKVAELSPSDEALEGEDPGARAPRVFEVIIHW